MYYCNSCDSTFINPATTPADILNPSETVCPFCGDDYIEEMEICPMCHDNYVKAPNKRCTYCSISVEALMNKTLLEIMEFNRASKNESIDAIVDWVEENQ